MNVPIMSRPDVLVAGGGAAGIAAAIAAARSGAEVLLLEQNGFLGGTLTAVTLGGVCGGYRHVDGTVKPLVGGIHDRLMDALQSMGAVSPVRVYGFVHGVPYDSEALRSAADTLVLEAGVQLMLHARVTDVAVDGRRIVHVDIETRGGKRRVAPSVVIDTSGDACVVFRAGGSFRLGDNGRTQHASSMFRMAGVDTDTFFAIPRRDVDAILERAKEEGALLPRTSIAVYPTPVPGVVHLNATRVQQPNGEPYDLTDPLAMTQAELEGRRQAERYAQILKERMPGFQNAKIVSLGAMLGIRETRLIDGDSLLSDEHILQCLKPEDRIACSAWPVEDHGTGGKTVWKPLPDGEWYGIPYGCLVSKDFDNVLVAGRCLSASHTAQASARVAATCMAMGEAAGEGAAMALNQDGNVRVEVGELQERLRGSGAVLEG